MPELRRRVRAGALGATPTVIARLRDDPRRGARELGAQLARVRDGERRERQRLGRLLELERELWSGGLRRVAGVDEAGIGPLAGPVVAAAVVFAPGAEPIAVDDSKKLDAHRRAHLAEAIRAAALGVGVGIATVAEIEALNVYHAAGLAMRRALEALPEAPEHILVDGRPVPDALVPQQAVVGGDGRHYAIAAASIIAKTHRDGLLVALDARYPAYGFARHKGYATAAHVAAIRRVGPCPEHRGSFLALDELTGACSEAYTELRARLQPGISAADLDAVEAELVGAREGLDDGEYRRLRAVLRRLRKSP